MKHIILLLFWLSMSSCLAVHLYKADEDIVVYKNRKKTDSLTLNNGMVWGSPQTNSSKNHLLPIFVADTSDIHNSSNERPLTKRLKMKQIQLGYIESKVIEPRRIINKSYMFNNNYVYFHLRGGAFIMLRKKPLSSIGFRNALKPYDTP